MQRYDSYKDSGIQWLGEIPSHWEVKHLRNFLTIFSEKGHGDKQLLSVTRENGVILRDKENKEENHNFVPDDLSGYKHVYAGDFVINKMKSWQGSYGVSDYEGIVSPAYFTCKLRGVNPKFFSRAIRSKAYIGFFMQFSKGIRVDQWDLDPNSMKDIPFVLPPLPEQQAIASYLDTATAKIDEAIAQQQKMIDLLNERKQIIINNAVTKGLNPNAKMKPSGIDWIGNIPEHWEVKPIKRCCEFVRTKSNRPHSYRVALENIQSWTGQYIQTDSVFDGLGILFKKGDVLFGKLRPYLAKVFLADQDGEALGDFWVFRPKTEILSEYLQIILLSYRVVNLIDSTTYGTKMPRADWGLNSHLMIPIPPIDSQNEIIKSIHTDCAQIDASINNFKKTIDLLRERKQIIINDVVTGKVKV